MTAPGLGSFLRQRGQHVLRYTYLLTGSATTARDLGIRSLVELGSRWSALQREYGDPERAILVVAARRYLDTAAAMAPLPDDVAAWTRSQQPDEPPEQLTLVEPPAGVDVPTARPIAIERGDPAEHDELTARWALIRALPPVERTDLVLQYWAELDAETLNRLLGRRRARVPHRLSRRLPRGLLRPRASAPPNPGGRPLAAEVAETLRHAERYAPDLDPDLLAAVESAVGTERVRRHGKAWIAVAVALAVLAGVVGLESARPEAAPRAGPREPREPLSWGQAWPQVVIRDFDAELADGSRYEPLRFVDLKTVIAATPPLSTEPALLLVDTEKRTARRLGPLPPGPVRVLTAADSTYVAWMVSGDGSTGDQIWTAQLDGSPAKLAATVPISASSSVHVIGLGRNRVWIVTARTRGIDDVVVETFSAPVGGGPVQKEPLTSSLWPISWPWFGTVVRPPQRSVVVRNAVTGERRRGRIPPDTTGVCGPTWCIGQRLSTDDTSADERTYIGPLSGTWYERVRLESFEGGTGAAPVLAERFVLTRSRDASGTLLYDILQRREVRIPGSVQRISDSGTLLGWWDNSVRRTRWRVVDLASIP